MATSTKLGFHIAPFGIDGEQVGVGFWANSSLSDEWLGVCSEFLNEHGAAFDSSWGGKLGQIRTKFTSQSSRAFATFFVNGKIASSLLLLSGPSSDVERTVTEMFVDSLKRTVRTQATAVTPYPFSKINSMKERPLMVVVAWPDDAISEQDRDLVRELGLHLAGAFFSTGI